MPTRLKIKTPITDGNNDQYSLNLPDTSNWDENKTIATEEYVDEAIFNSENLEFITYSALKDKRDNDELIPGKFYRITDYNFTTSKTGTSSANHQFDLIVLALTVNKLSEKAFAAIHNGDSYFADSKLNKWELKYSLDNDTNRFDWASSTGKGVIYYLKDEFENECSYDFKNCLFNNITFPNSQFDPEETDELIDNVYTFNCFSPEEENLDVSLNNSSRFSCFSNSILNLKSKELLILSPNIYYMKKSSVYMWHEIRNNVILQSSYCIIYNNSTNSQINQNHFTNCKEVYFKGQSFYNNVLESYDYSNSGSEKCIYLVYFKDSCTKNTIKGSAKEIYFGINCSNNLLDNTSTYQNEIHGSGQLSEFIYLGNNCSGNVLLGCHFVLFGPSKSALLENCRNNKLDTVFYCALTPETGESFNNLVFHKGINLYESDESWAHVLLVPEGSDTYETNIYASNSQTVIL